MTAAHSMDTAIAAVVKHAVAEALAEYFDQEHQTKMQESRALSLVAGAKLARCRKATLQRAVESGACAAKRHGTRWSLLASDVAAWVRAGKPVRP